MDALDLKILKIQKALMKIRKKQPKKKTLKAKKK